MALTDSGSGRKVRIAAGLTPEQVGGFPLLLSGTVKEGDPLGYSSGWVRADANATIYPVYVAGADGVAGETIFGYLLALVEGYTAGAPGNAVYLSDTAGRVSESAGTNKVRVGTVVDTTKAILAPALWGAVSTDVLISLTTMLSDWRKSTDLTKIDGADVSDGTLPLASIVNLTSARLIVGSAANVPTAVDVTGDVTISNAGVTAIAAGVIIDADVNASAAIAYSKLAALASARLLVGSAANVATAVDVTGDVTISNAGVTAIAAGVIIDADVNASAAIAYSKLAALASARLIVGSAANVATAVDVTGDVTISNAGVTAITADSIIDADVKTDAAIAYSKLAALASARLIVGSAANVATAVDITGDVTISNAGVTAIAGGVIVNADVNAAAAIAHSKMALPNIGFISESFTRAQMTDDGGTSGHFDLVTTIPANSLVLGWQANVTTGFTGDVSAVIQAGIAGDLDRFSADTAESVFAVTANVGSLPLAADAAKGIGGAVTVRVTITSAADFTNVAAGGITMRIAYLTLA